MMLLFHIHFVPEKGHDLYLNIVEGEKTVISRKMNADGEGEWKLELKIPQATQNAGYNAAIDYYYSIQEKDKVLRTEWMMPRGEGVMPACPHHLPMMPTTLQSFTTYDSWMDEPIDAIFFTEPFLQCLNKRTAQQQYVQQNSAILRIKVYAPQLKGNERLVLCGSHPVLGEWHPERGIPCFEQSPNEWVCDINTEYTANEDLEYKFVAMAKTGKAPSQPIPADVPIIPTTTTIAPAKVSEEETVSWEIGYNRHLTVPRIKKGEMVQYCQRNAAFERSIPRMAGTIVSIKNTRDFSVVRGIIDWMADTHQQWLLIDTREITRSNHTKRLQELKEYALSCHIVMECKITSRNKPLSQWWDEDTDRAEDYYKDTLQRRDDVPHPIPSWLARDIMMRELLKPGTMLCLFPYEDWKLLGDIKAIQTRDNIREMLAEAQRIY